jgi:peptidoglycan hydrolase-like protein with peptidoglycan-binding domain
MRPRFIFGVASAGLLLIVIGTGLPLSASAQLLFQPTPPITAVSSTPSQEPSGYGGYYGYGQNSSAINGLIGQLPAQAPPILSMPILFGVEPADLTPNFGDPRPNGRTHQGEDILAPRDSLIISPTQAVVIEVGAGPSSGNYVSTANPGGEKFVYMHLDSMSTLKVGDTLQPGDFIGYVGNTGDAAGGPTHLHFEIWKNNVPTDPFARLKGEFPLAQKMIFTENIFTRSTDKATLAQLLVTMDRNQFIAAQAAGISLPPEIAAEMLRTPMEGLGTAAHPVAGDLTIGSSGSAVIVLQNFLISQNKGPAARALANAGPTGNLGSITSGALSEYQAAAGIVPADGYDGPATRANIQAVSSSTPVQASVSSPAVMPPASAAATTTINITTPTVITTLAGGATSSAVSAAALASMPATDLDLGSRGAGVIWLQTFLIAAHAGVASQSLAEAGATGYFGAVTRAALAEYQAKAGIAPAAGYFGPVTRARLKASIGAQ